MGCQSQVDIGHFLTFSICTHDPDTGELADADANPPYRLYEDETAIPILIGTMAKLDDANTLGFYTERIQCTLGNGFEHGKSYTIYIEAQVDGDTGGIALSFRAITAPNNLSAAQVAAALAAYDGPTDAEMLAAFAALNNLSAAQVNAEVVDGLNGDVYAEPPQGAPLATATLAAKIGYLYKAFRNRLTQNATTLRIYNDAGAVVDQRAPVSDDGVTYTRGEIISGP